MQSDDLHLQHTFRKIEWASLALTAVCQWFWLCYQVQFHCLALWSFFFLAVAFALACCSVPKTAKNRFLYLIAQITVLTIACTLGAHRHYFVIFLVLGAKIGILLPRRHMIMAAITLATGIIIGGHCARYVVRHVYTPKLNQPEIISVVLESENSIYFLIGLATVIFLGRTVISEQKSRRTEKMLAKEVEQMAVGLERSRIARDIHDALGHTLTSLTIQLELVSKLFDDNEHKKAQDLLLRCQDSASRSLKEVRRAVKAIRDEDFDLNHAVVELTNQFNESCACTFKIHFDEVELPSSTRHQIFSIIQESLTNIQKHTSATRVEIAFQESNGSMELSVRDNGQGFALQNKHRGFGLKGMRERAEAIGGAFKIESVIGHGTQIVIDIPAAASKILTESQPV